MRRSRNRHGNLHVSNQWDFLHRAKELSGFVVVVVVVLLMMLLLLLMLILLLFCCCFAIVVVVDDDVVIVVVVVAAFVLLRPCFISSVRILCFSQNKSGRNRRTFMALWFLCRSVSPSRHSRQPRAPPGTGSPSDRLWPPSGHP